MILSKNIRKIILLIPLILLSGSLIYLNILAFATEHPVINEFELNPPGNDNSRDAEEWVEIYNPTSQVVDIGNWTLTTGYKSIIEIIPEGTLIEPGEYYVIARGSVWLVNSEEFLILRNESGEEVDRTPVKNDDDNNASSWYRYPNGQDTDSDNDWIYRSSTRGALNKIDVVVPTICTNFPLTENVTVHFIDVGQGDSIFVDTPNLDMLIDGGESWEGDTVVEYLQDLGISQIDVVVATHPDSDHIGGLVYVLEYFGVIDTPKVIDSGYEHKTVTYSKYVNEREKREYLTAFRGYGFLLDDCVNVTVLNPAINAEGEYEFKNRNENSVILRMVVGNVVFLFTGDAGEYAEEKMLDAGLELSASILKVGHHGSTYSSSSDFLIDVDPQVGIICVGAGNSHGHPHPGTIENLTEMGITYYRTDEYGNVVITTDGTGYEVLVERTADNDIALTRMIAVSILAAEIVVLFRNRP